MREDILQLCLLRLVLQNVGLKLGKLVTIFQSGSLEFGLKSYCPRVNLVYPYLGIQDLLVDGHQGSRGVLDLRVEQARGDLDICDLLVDGCQGIRGFLDLLLSGRNLATRLTFESA